MAPAYFSIFISLQATEQEVGPWVSLHWWGAGHHRHSGEMLMELCFGVHDFKNQVLSKLHLI